MGRPAEFQYDEQIPDGEVAVLDASLGDEFVYLPRDEAIQMACARGLNLVAWWPGQDADDVSCIFRKVTLPLRWETLPRPESPQLDEQLWFEASCGDRDLLMGAGGHTYPGRMLAWCPHQEHHVYSVSLNEMGEMSTASRYFVRGYLAGQEPEVPYDDDGEITPEDELAWELATYRFRQTGSWSGGWDTCADCGCVLLPDSTSDHCAEHRG